ncbi:glycosyl hydrolase [Aspergillus venezuelensis]
MFCKASAVLEGITLLLSLVQHSKAENPIVQDIYTADPAPIVHDNRVYIFAGHDEDGSTEYNVNEWRLFSSSDMANWQHHPSPMSISTFSWASARAWAGHVINRNNKFYFYVPIRHRATGNMSIGVGVSDEITGPYKDAIGEPLLENNEIDPAAFIDDDGQAYLYWGNPRLWYVTLNDDMISYSGDMTEVHQTVESFGEPYRPDPSDDQDRPTAYEEGPWLYKRDGTYYMIYAANCCPENIQYSTADSPTGPWNYEGTIMDVHGTSSTNHPGIVEYKGMAYFVYHNSALPGGGSYTRSVSVESFKYNEDGTIPKLKMTKEGPPQVGTLDPFVRQEAETMAWSKGIETEACSEGGLNVNNINDGDYIKVRGVGFGDGAETFRARVASGGDGGAIDLRVGKEDGKVIGTCEVKNTGGWQKWVTVDCPVSRETGKQDLYFVFAGEGTGSLFSFNWWQFE